MRKDRVHVRHEHDATFTGAMHGERHTIAVVPALMLVDCSAPRATAGVHPCSHAVDICAVKRAGVEVDERLQVTQKGSLMTLHLAADSPGETCRHVGGVGRGGRI